MTPTIRIQREDFDPGLEIAKLGTSQTGAVASFVGLVRGGCGLTSLTIDHYPGMSESEIIRHVKEAETRWPLLGATVIHRIGELPVGARIVLVAASAAHRRAAFEACEFLMDYLKASAPFWKIETRGSETRWVEARTADDDAVQKWTSR